MSALDPSSSAALAAAALTSSGSGRPLPQRRPDPAEALLAAVRGRDAQLAAHLVQHWVHRRGVASLESFRLQLAVAEGEQACHWLQGLIDAPMQAATAAPSPPAASPSAASQEPVNGGRITATVDQAVLAYWQETSPVVPGSRPPQIRVPTSSSKPEPETGSEPAAGELPAPVRLGRRVAAVGRQSLFGLRSLVRDCLDEAIGGLSGGSATPAPPAAAALVHEPAAPAPHPWKSRAAATGAARQGPAAIGNRPAPAPAALSDLRAWLPDSGDQGTPAH